MFLCGQSYVSAADAVQEQIAVDYLCLCPLYVARTDITSWKWIQVPLHFMVILIKILISTIAGCSSSCREKILQWSKYGNCPLLFKMSCVRIGLATCQTQRWMEPNKSNNLGSMCSQMHTDKMFARIKHWLKISVFVVSWCQPLSHLDLPLMKLLYRYNLVCSFGLAMLLQHRLTLRSNRNTKFHLNQNQFCYTYLY